MSLKTEAYYDVGCDCCGFHISTDWGTGMFLTKREAAKAAKDIGFTSLDGKNICPCCLEKIKRNAIRKD